MNELQHWAAGSSSIVPSRDERQHKKVVATVVRETQLAGHRVDAEAALTGRLMERTVDLDQHRRALAGNDETLNMMLTRIELGFVDKGVRIQRQFGSAFPL